MTGQRGQFGIILGVVLVVLVLAIIGLFAVCTPGEDDHGLGRVQLVRYDEQPRCYDDGWCDDDGGDGYSQRYDQNYGSRDDRNRNRGRDRGAFSPGPFRDSPVIVCLPYSCNSGGEQSGGNRENPPPGDQPPPEDQR